MPGRCSETETGLSLDLHQLVSKGGGRDLTDLFISSFALASFPYFDGFGTPADLAALWRVLRCPFCFSHLRSFHL